MTLLRLQACLERSFGGSLQEGNQKVYEALNIPKSVGQQYFKQVAARHYSFKKKKFCNFLNGSFAAISYLRLLVFFLLVLFRSKRWPKKTRLSVDLLIDDIQHYGETDRWLKLIGLFGDAKTLLVLRNKLALPKSSDLNTLILINGRGYSRSIFIKIPWVKLLFISFRLIRPSFKSGINYVECTLRFLNDFLYYSTVFAQINSKFMIQDRNLGRTNALKNYLFKVNGGKLATCIQKNITQLDGNALYYDTDVLFTLGNQSASNLIALGGRIDQCVAVGSFAFENSRRSGALTKVETVWDLLFVGINVKSSLNTNWQPNYYKSLKWLRMISDLYPNLRVGIKHHPSWTGDPLEENFIKNSGVVYLDSNSDSYSVALSAKKIATFGSTMGFELIGLGKNVRFLDPNGDNNFIDDFVRKERVVVNDFSSFKNWVLYSKREALLPVDSSDFCLNSATASKNINQFFRNEIRR